MKSPSTPPLNLGQILKGALGWHEKATDRIFYPAENLTTDGSHPPAPGAFSPSMRGGFRRTRWPTLLSARPSHKVIVVTWYDWCWLSWPQIDAPLSADTRSYIERLDPIADARTIVDAGLPPSCARVCDSSSQDVGVVKVVESCGSVD